ncbi:MAG: bifunctional phosphoribosylaminoimidazolecarboxamide formyltransferase/IMP cyclohydrolase [Bacteroidales bacterium]|nr:bifunctional phosphoribosylaminoimidazolecarboxamide formyltransferase/IMP cyclohydrolase [Bacteroidales bacterium]MCF8389374.1 bifunctional phosphoribosylaminoimidazolecarboxamide formyltransferase/IMP cyclohydrolase [Bacteroidales bacterium]
MNTKKKIHSALISVYHKDNLEELVNELLKNDVSIYSTGGTKTFIESLGAKVTAVEDLTAYPSIFGGRVKTLHPKVFGGILSRRDDDSDKKQAKEYDIPEIDLVIVDLYPFEETLKSGADEAALIEKIDIGGISLIRAAAKNFKDVVVVSSRGQYEELSHLLREKKGCTDIEDRRRFATAAFHISSHYDSAIFNYFDAEGLTAFKESLFPGKKLRYGENPHQEGYFYGDFDEIFEKLYGKEISYNNLLDIDAAVNLIGEFDEPTFAILKHNNACGIASRPVLFDAWTDALAGDPVSAFGGILVTNVQVDVKTAEEINKLFYEVIIAPAYEDKALEVLMQKKNRIILVQRSANFKDRSIRTVLNGALVQDKDVYTESAKDLTPVTNLRPGKDTIQDLLFANKIVKHTKSNTIVLAKNKQLCASGVGQTSRVDALKQAIEKAKSFDFDLQGAVMASDAFFPFADSVEIANKAGITSVIQPGGSIKDQDSIDYCNLNKMSMVFTGIRHFKH